MEYTLEDMEKMQTLAESRGCKLRSYSYQTGEALLIKENALIRVDHNGTEKPFSLEEFNLILDSYEKRINDAGFGKQAFEEMNWVREQIMILSNSKTNKEEKNHLTQKENSEMLTQYKIYFNNHQLKNMKEMPVREYDAEKSAWIQQKDAEGNLLTETRCIIDLPKEAYYLKKDGHRLDLKGYNIVMRNQFFRSEHDNGYYCIVDANKKYRLDRISPLTNENGEVQKTANGKTMWDFDSKKSLYVSGKQLKVMMDAWKTKEKKPVDLKAYKQKAKEYNDSKEKEEKHKEQKQER